MKKIVLIFLLLYSTLALAAKSELELKLNFNLIAKVNKKEFEQGALHFNKNKISSLDITLYNPWRKYEKTYKAYNFFELLDLYFTHEWQNAKEISFVALDGYVQKAKIVDMIKESKNKTGYLAYSESNQTGFSKFYKDKKLIDPAPFYLLWSNFSEHDQVKHSDVLKWPFQLKTIIISK